MKFRYALYTLGVAVVLLSYHGVSTAQQVVGREEAAGMVQIDNLRIDGDRIAGEIVNRSPHAVRDVQLLIRHAWLWQNEFRPGSDDLGTAVYHMFDNEIAPGERAAFTHRFAEPLPERPGGSFETAVSVAGFTSVILPR